ncbi:hypothetical protein LPB140_07850 [Sphingorhabdus lutea]|uniref:MarR family transcriptional regulator n=1 Tax=Sphingorhabdus lutea TaxID=1913578 RepID=A0A1L3JC65_9SPHN|nr:MarR family winged helix-turn-helix transcriptional regulator [Sphingorhabdus lutea]APG62720.1 hypothetical protein LPB140_07850 [Sphingorhabdus lutea]
MNFFNRKDEDINVKTKKSFVSNYQKFIVLRSLLSTNINFVNPIWALLYEIYERSKKEDGIAISSLGLDNGIPLTSVLRYVDEMTNDGIIHKVRDKKDKRRMLVKMEPKIDEQLDAIFDL